MRANKTIKWTIVTLCLLAMLGNKALCQTNKIAMDAADTTNFACNYQGGWQIYNSYVAYTPNRDSATVELIIQHSNNISWNQQQFLGRIKPLNYRPSSERTCNYSIQSRKYSLRIDLQGNVWLTYLSANIPIVDDPNVLIIKISFKL